MNIDCNISCMVHGNNIIYFYSFLVNVTNIPWKPFKCHAWNLISAKALKYSRIEHTHIQLAVTNQYGRHYDRANRAYLNHSTTHSVLVDSQTHVHNEVCKRGDSESCFHLIPARNNKISQDFISFP